ncbi:MAG: desulfoferrodoxin Dfx [Bacteroidales bacterium]|nr:desulfoferrodoxin Dfx [Bacteroidales bacterium]
MSVKFFKCRHCGNVITKVVDSGVKVVCCGEQMAELVPNTTDAAGEKHIPVITVEGNKVNVKVSTVEHPATEAHWIQFIVLETANGCQTKFLTPADKPEANFVIAEGDKVVAAYEYCNLHGLWKAE